MDEGVHSRGSYCKPDRHSNEVLTGTASALPEHQESVASRLPLYKGFPYKGSEHKRHFVCKGDKIRNSSLHFDRTMLLNKGNSQRHPSWEVEVCILTKHCTTEILTHQA